jgi:hypothetical protein
MRSFYFKKIIADAVKRVCSAARFNQRLRTKSSRVLPTRRKRWEKEPVPILDFKSLFLTGRLNPDKN